MDFDLTDEQRLLKDSVERLLADQLRDFEQRKGYMKEPDGLERARSGSSTPSSGCSALPFAEEHGGFGGGPVETMIVMEAFGRGAGAGALSSRPSCSAAACCAAPATTAQQQALLPQIAEGKLTLAFAHRERQARYDLADVGDHRAAGRRRLHARRREERRAARRLRRQADRDGARLRRPRATAAASACSWSMPRPAA